MIGFIHDSNKYLYIRDVLQNILGIIDINGNVVVKYDCDAFGKINNITGSKASTIGKYNPFRYKGYYYDEESSMYYCKSRYYVPEWCRWLNADSPSFLEPTIPNQMNLFTYCSNNPIANIDSNGKFGFLATLLIGALVGAVIGGTISGIKSYNNGERNGDLVADIAGGALQGAFTFGIGYFSGKNGLYNSMSNLYVDGDFYLKVGFNKIRSLIYGIKSLFDESISRSIIVGGVASAIRGFIEWLIPDEF